MAFDVTKMIDTDYMNETREKLIAKMVLEGITMSEIKVIPGIKNSIALNLVDNTITVQDGTCGWNAAGTMSLGQKKLAVSPKKVNDSLCPKDLEKLYLGEFMRSNKELPFTEIFSDTYVNRVKRYNEQVLWDGDADDIDGFVKLVGDSTAVVDASVAVAAATTAMGKVNAMIAAAPSELLEAENKIIFCSYGFYNQYATELRAANVFMLANTDYKNGNYQMYIPGTDIRLIATVGLDNLTNNTVDTGSLLIFTFGDNLVAGTDMLDDEEMFDIWYSRDNDEVRVNIQWKLGTQTYFDDRIVRGYTLV